MAYTVKQLANLSGVSVRTLHWYDQQGLLVPAYRGANGYRYYEEEQLLVLQQILFFKELGFNLNDIEALLGSDYFNQIHALETHRRVLLEEIERKKQLVETIDKTLRKLMGIETMKNEELYYGFDSDKQKEYEQYIVREIGHESESLLKESHRRTAKWDKAQWDEAKKTGDHIHQDLAEAINNGLSAESDEVQAIIQRHYDLQNRFYNLTKEVYIGLTDLYADHPDFKKFFDAYHPRMIEFLSAAMKYFATHNL